jgi:hypothetical protein
MHAQQLIHCVKHFASAHERVLAAMQQLVARLLDSGMHSLSSSLTRRYTPGLHRMFKFHFSDQQMCRCSPTHVQDSAHDDETTQPFQQQMRQAHKFRT